MTPEERAENIVAFLDGHNILMTDTEWDLFAKEVLEAIKSARAGRAYIVIQHGTYDARSVQIQ